MIPVVPSTSTDVETAVTESNSPEISHNSTRDSVVTVRLSDSTSTLIHDEALADLLADECAIEDSTDMVDIRLSDPTPQNPIYEDQAPESPIESFPQMDEMTNKEWAAMDLTQEGSTSILPEEVKVIQKIRRQSMLSMLSAVDEANSDATSLSIRSRSDSSGTFSSLSSANVDWLELEKKEEEAPRDEASDEVGHFQMNK